MNNELKQVIDAIEKLPRDGWVILRPLPHGGREEHIRATKFHLLTAEISRLTRQLELAEAALRYYANPERHVFVDASGAVLLDASKDAPKRAIEALAEMEAK